MVLFEPTDLKYFDNKVVPGRARVDWEMQKFRQLGGTLDFGWAQPGFTITLTGPSYTVERFFPRTEPSG